MHRSEILSPTAISLRGVSKLYPGVVALDAVDLDVAAGSVHAVVGENGAGKSTLLKILCGAHQPSAGALRLFGDEVELPDPAAARRHGIAAVHQELTIVPTLSAAANVFLGQERRLGPLQDRRAERRRFRELCAELDVELDPDARADTLSVADRQSLEIMRGIESTARVLVLDEPTASLAQHEREALYRVVSSLSSRGVTVVLISHDLDEVVRLSDAITVLCDGRRVATRATREWTKQSLIHAMLGAAVAARPPHTRRAADVLLRAESVAVPGVLAGVDLDVRHGEILGVTGLLGSGRTELLRALAGLDPESTGRLVLDGRPQRWPRSPLAALRLGIALVPEDRKAQGVLLGMPAHDNINVTNFRRVARRSLISRRRALGRAHELGRRVRLQEGATTRLARNLSGGNQQKLVLAKWLDRDVRVLLIDEPTRGIDIGARAEIHALLDELARGGMAIVMVSSELEEVVDNCDRALVLGGGGVVARIDGDGLSKDSLMATLFKAEQS